MLEIYDTIMNMNDKFEMSFCSGIDIHYVVIIINKKYASIIY